MTTEHTKRCAIVYIRQSTLSQVTDHKESQRRQYALADKAKEYGFSRIQIIDEDLGRSGSGVVDRPGFSKMVALVCAGDVGAIFCIEASRLARNGRDWHHLIDLCSLVRTLIIDPEGIYDPLITNDRLLLGLKGTMSEFELNLFRQRSFEALRQKAMRGELKFRLPIGLSWTRHNKIELEPDQRVQEAIHLVFKKFSEFASARQTLLWFREKSITLPRIVQDEFDYKIIWQLPIYKNILSILQNPLYAGAYGFGKTENRTKVVEGRARKTRGHRKPKDRWLVLIKDHHPGYISWQRFEENQKMLLSNTHHLKAQNSPKSGRGGKALLAGLLRCGHCSRMLHIVYCGIEGKVARYYCRGAHINYGTARCISFGSLRADEAISSEILKAVENDAIDAAFKAAEQISVQHQEHKNALSLEIEQARYEVRLAANRYESVDPANRLVAGELEARWNQALERVAKLENSREQLESLQQQVDLPSRETFLNLAKNLSTVWNLPSTEMKLKQRILRLLICEIIASFDQQKSEIILTIHWKGGRHSDLRIIKNKTGHHGRSNSLEAVEVITQMASSSPDKVIAATLNRLGIKTGTGNSWNQSRVKSARNYNNLPCYKEIDREAQSTFTLKEAAKELKISDSSVRRLIKLKIIEAKQPVSCAPWQIQKTEFEKESVKEVVQLMKQGKKIPSTHFTNSQNLVLFPLLQGGA